MPAIRAALMQSRRLAGSLVADREPMRLERLAVEVADAWERYQAGEFAALAERLPGLLADARLAMNERGSGNERVQALRLFARDLARRLRKRTRRRDAQQLAVALGAIA